MNCPVRVSLSAFFASIFFVYTLMHVCVCAATPPFYCNICRKDISFEPRIKCLSCKNFDLCIDCFRVGAEIFPHEATHPYIVCRRPRFTARPSQQAQLSHLSLFHRSLRSSTFRSSSPTGLPSKKSFCWTPLPRLVLATGKQLFAAMSSSSHLCTRICV